jgi:hypothetical protein
MTGNELKWWQEHKIEPLSVAQTLWLNFKELNRHPPSDQTTLEE